LKLPNPIEAQFGRCALDDSDDPNHTLLAHRLQGYLRWRNANARHPDVPAHPMARARPRA
jgi:hypothetical protein